MMGLRRPHRPAMTVALTRRRSAMSRRRPRSPRPPRPLVALALALALTLPGLALAPPARAAACVVTSTADHGDNTLRAAIDNSDNFAFKVTGCTTISFALPGAAPWFITLASG